MLNETLHADNRLVGLIIPGRHQFERHTKNRSAGFSHALSYYDGRRPEPPASDVALHEAGHAIALLCNGYKVKRIRATAEDGKCTPYSQPCDRVLSVAAAAGAIA